MTLPFSFEPEPELMNTNFSWSRQNGCIILKTIRHLLEIIIKLGSSRSSLLKIHGAGTVFFKSVDPEPESVSPLVRRSGAGREERGGEGIKRRLEMVG